MNLKEIQSIYFIGIGGIGMSALAKYFHLNGKIVSGYDKFPSPLTTEMMSAGIAIHFEEDIATIPKDADLVVYTPAVPSDHQELLYYQNHNYKVIKRADLLEAVTKNAFTIAVAGTHGKTTTACMVAHILKYSGFDCTAFLGGIAANYDSNFLSGKNDVVVVEADEFDRSFLKLHPDIEVITSSDADHLDIYGTTQDVEKSFADFAGKLKTDGKLITKENLSFLKYVPQTRNICYYDIEDVRSDFYSADLQLIDGTYQFTFHAPKDIIENIHLSIAGRHNVENAVAAAAVAYTLSIPKEKISKALSTFKGVKRRFEFIVKNESVVYIDDYAHHPVEINAFLSSVREIFPDRKITCVFQPHLFSRTRDFANEFGKALSTCDDLILLPIYPAREAPIDGISSNMLLGKISIPRKIVCEKNQLIGELAKRAPKLVVTMGAGDIDQLVQPTKFFLTRQH
ncbi:MAG: UDP-N-acetylmuramate--L-alanine ligase [Chitinophagales bacterium]|nr:UDP-N-acetylmuramate--L-alanine ligase [Chitinophagales bacterium]